MSTDSWQDLVLEFDEIESPTPSSSSSGTIDIGVGSSAWDDLLVDDGQDLAVTQALNTHSNAALCAAIPVVKYNKHAEHLLPAITHLAAVAKADAKAFTGVMTLLSLMAKPLSRGDAISLEQLTAAATVPLPVLQKAATMKPSPVKTRVYYANLVSYLRSSPRVKYSVAGKKVTVSSASYKIHANPTDYGAISWEGPVQSLLDEISLGKVTYVTTGDLFTDAIVMAFCMHHKVTKTGHEGKVKVEINDRVFSGNAQTYTPLTDTPEHKFAKKTLDAVFRIMARLCADLVVPSWSGDPTAHLIAALGAKLLIPPDKQVAITKAIKIVNAHVNSLTCPYTISTRTIFSSQQAITYMSNPKNGKASTVVGILEAGRSFKGAKDDIANTTLESVPIPTWWLGSVRHTLLWEELGPIMGGAKITNLTVYGGSSSTERQRLEETYSSVAYFAPYHNKWSEYSPIDTMTPLSSYENGALFYDHIVIPTISTKATNATVNFCNTQVPHVEHFVSKAVDTSAVLIAARCYPMITNNVIDYSYLGTLAELHNEEYPYIGVCQGSSPEMMEIIFILSAKPFTGGVKWTTISSKFAPKDFGARIAGLVAACASAIIYQATTMIYYGVTKLAPPHELLISALNVDAYEEDNTVLTDLLEEEDFVLSEDEEDVPPQGEQHLPGPESPPPTEASEAKTGTTSTETLEVKAEATTVSTSEEKAGETPADLLKEEVSESLTDQTQDVVKNEESTSPFY
jgi:hypothetical protein